MEYMNFQIFFILKSLCSVFHLQKVLGWLAQRCRGKCNRVMHLLCNWLLFEVSINDISTFKIVVTSEYIGNLTVLKWVRNVKNQVIPFTSNGSKIMLPHFKSNMPITARFFLFTSSLFSSTIYICVWDIISPLWQLLAVKSWGRGLVKSTNEIHGVNTIKCESSYISRHVDFRSSLLK